MTRACGSGHCRILKGAVAEPVPRVVSKIVWRWRLVARKVLEDPAIKKRIEDTGSLVIGNTPEQFSAQIKAEYEVYKKVVDSAKLRLE